VYKGRNVGSTYSNDKILNLYPKVVKYLGEKESLKRTALLSGVSVPTVIKVKKILANE
jgi:hypothetical protein